MSRCNVNEHVEIIRMYLLNGREGMVNQIFSEKSEQSI